MRSLSREHKKKVEDLIRARTQTAWQFTSAGGMVAALFMVFVARRALSGSEASPNTLVSYTALALAVWIGLAWWLGWRRIFAMRLDLRIGRLETTTGPMEAIEVVRNAYGELITHVTIDGVRYTTRDALFDGFEQGSEVTVDYLPRSRVPLSVHPAADRASIT